MSSQRPPHVDTPHAGTAPRRRQARAEETRRALLEAALTEFAEKGFEAASTRAIAHAAGAHQPQINYHFESKEELWRAAVDHLFGQLDEVFGAHTGDLDCHASARDRLAVLIRAFVHSAAELPELNRIMVREATTDSARLRWIVDRHTRPRFAEAVDAWRAAQIEGGVTPMDEAIFYYSFIGASSLVYVNAPEARLLGCDPSTPEFVSAHAEAVVRMFLPESPGPPDS